MKINYCKKCHDAKRIKSLEKVVEELTKIVGLEVEVSTRCASFCGPGKKKFFLLQLTKILLKLTIMMN